MPPSQEGQLGETLRDSKQVFVKDILAFARMIQKRRILDAPDAHRDYQNDGTIFF